MDRSFQSRVASWSDKCFSEEVITVDTRLLRFIEEALELIQSCNIDRSIAIEMVNYVYDRNHKGSIENEVGDVMVTLAALSQSLGIKMDGAGERALIRINKPDKFSKIKRMKRANLSLLKWK